MKIWEEVEFLNIRNFIIFFSFFFYLISWAYNFAFSEFYSSRIVQMYIHISKKGINISLRILNLNVLKEVYHFVLGQTLCSAGEPNAARGPGVGQPWFIIKYFNRFHLFSIKIRN